MSDHQLTALAQKAEAQFMYRYLACAPIGVKVQLGIATASIGGGHVLSMRNDDSGYWSQALGLGIDEPVTDAVIAEAVDFYRSQGNDSASFRIAPSSIPDDWADICARRGLVPSGRTLKLARALDEIRPLAEPSRRTLRVGTVGTDDAVQWANVCLRGLGFPVEGQAEMLAASVEDPMFRSFAVWDGAEIVGAANLFIFGEIGHLNTAAVVGTARGRGGQSALIDARIRAAIDAGCRWIVAETGKPGPSVINHSTNNLLRAGLRAMFVRQNYRWRDTASR